MTYDQTPNFAMDVDDVIWAIGEAQNSGLSAEGQKFTVHFFDEIAMPEILGCHSHQVV